MAPDWQQYFQTHSSKYASNGYRWQDGTDPDPDQDDTPLLSAGDLLRRLRMLPSHTTTEIYGLLSRRLDQKVSIHNCMLKNSQFGDLLYSQRILRSAQRVVGFDNVPPGGRPMEFQRRSTYFLCLSALERYSEPLPRIVASR